VLAHLPPSAGVAGPVVPAGCDAAAADSAGAGTGSVAVVPGLGAVGVVYQRHTHSAVYQRHNHSVVLPEAYLTVWCTRGTLTVPQKDQYLLSQCQNQMLAGPHAHWYTLETPSSHAYSDTAYSDIPVHLRRPVGFLSPLICPEFSVCCTWLTIRWDPQPGCPWPLLSHTPGCLSLLLLPLPGVPSGPLRLL